MKQAPQASGRQRLSLGLSVLGLGLLGGLWCWSPLSEASHEAVQLKVHADTEPSAAAAPSVGLARPMPPASSAFADWLHQHSVLRGTELDGGWGLGANGDLQPSLALRRRFDYLLQLQGQRSLDEIGAYLRELAGQQLSVANAEAVMAVWRPYLQLQQSRWRHSVNPQDPSTLAPALAEQQEARRRLLGPAWAHAFYGEDEGQVAALIQASAEAGGQPARSAELIDRSRLDAAALGRLQEEEAAQARWQARLKAAAAQLQALRQDSQLSELQRRQAIQALIEQSFEGSERLRARALLGAGGPP
ncbi:lipase chaperone LimK [Paucibacter oligotrophus]|uniref:Lipase chaperone LimK n=1 Tax=Roseateles oligotrophus TaxID=1769250 RepID=A0A840L9D8_9BURK|nr:lipase chaperone [Roseateles oligotrophus]MBB4843375.1 lipase chaperone LimK [Roseateles oligotrophus]